MLQRPKSCIASAIVLALLGRTGYAHDGMYGQFVLGSPSQYNLTQRADPIMSPGKISPHVHEFFGAGSLDGSFSVSELTYEKLQQTDCTTMGYPNGGAFINEDKSVYWHPALYVQSNTSDEYIRVPTMGHRIYYNDHGNSAPRIPFEWPPGFRMVAGNSFLRGSSPIQGWDGVVVQWECHGSNYLRQGEQGNFPVMQPSDTCDAGGEGLIGRITFPTCWNGKDFDQSDPTGHMTYASRSDENGDCPVTHPLRLPLMAQLNSWDLSSIGFKPNTFVLANGDTTGTSFHADFFNGWKAGTVATMMATCQSEGLPDPGTVMKPDTWTCGGYSVSGNQLQCGQKADFVEEVNTVTALPGCNPTDSPNPAPNYSACPISVANPALASGPSMTIVVPAVSPIATAINSVNNARELLMASTDVDVASAAALAAGAPDFVVGTGAAAATGPMPTGVSSGATSTSVSTSSSSTSPSPTVTTVGQAVASSTGSSSSTSPSGSITTVFVTVTAPCGQQKKRATIAFSA